MSANIDTEQKGHHDLKAKQIYTYCICGAFFVCAVVNATQGSMLSSFIEQYSLQSSAQGAIGSAQSLGQAFSLFFIFWQAGRVPKPTVVAVSFICIVVILFGISLSPPFLLLCLLYCLFGLVFGMISSTTSSLIADLFGGRDTPKYMSRLHGIFGLGGLIAPLFFLRLNNAGFHWSMAVRFTMALIAVMLVIYLGLSHFSIKSIELPSTSNQKIILDDIKVFLKNSSCIRLVFCVFLYSSHQSVIAVWMIRYISVVFNDVSLGALSLSLFWAGITVSRLFMHKVPIAPGKIVIFGNFASALVICVGVLSGSAVAMTCCAPIVGLLNGTTMPLLLAAGCAEMSGNTILPTNFLNLSMFLALTVCPLIVGALVHYTSMSAGMLLSAFCSLMCGILLYFYYRKK